MAERAVPQENTGINTGIQQSNGPYPEATAESLDLEDSHQQGACVYDLCPGTSSSCMTTKELQQHWGAVKHRLKPVKLLFEIPSARTIAQHLSKYVVYQIVLIRSGSYDSKRVSVERRYSDFIHLHQQLLEDFSEELEEVILPRKLLTGNFNPETIWERRLALRDYLAQLYAVRCVRHSHHFLDFFTEPEQRRAHGLLRAGQFGPAVALLETVLELQEKMGGWQSPVLLVPTLCALTVCQRDLEEPESAFTMGQRALPTGTPGTQDHDPHHNCNTVVLLHTVLQYTLRSDAGHQPHPEFSSVHAKRPGCRYKEATGRRGEEDHQ
ncbi:sorting nexin-20-like isoform X3 [Oncorhynchus nerka]|uniref:sorting nexin-20-like isoform X3 n=1 Tax=Oncorhynchus nerka TaxID=8023 RepID=UPI0011301894|nr:sorting nexin-20-like isoform X3 [Oncorhynchus nerka]